jgi:glycerophosphoryl diester phosphodiesterase
MGARQRTHAAENAEDSLSHPGGDTLSGMSMASRPPFLIEGHRGARGLWPENTLAGFAGALALDVDAIELDVMMTRDGVVVVTHDPRLNPDLTRDSFGEWLVGPGPAVASLDAAQLMAFDVGRARPGGVTALAFPAQVACDGARIPRLAEVLRLALRSRATVDVELKTNPPQPELSPHPAVLADAVVAAARDCGAFDRLAVRSFDWRGLRHMRDRWPQVPLTWLTAGAGPGPDEVARAAGGDGGRWGPNHEGLDLGMVERAHDLGLLVIPWTVNSLEAMRRLRDWGVDGICTDRPDVARSDR